LEEQRIGRMYFNLLKKRIYGLGRLIFGTGLRRSPALPWLIILVLIGVPSLGWYLHRRGQFHSLKQEIKGQHDETPQLPSPGGMEPLILRRTVSTGSTVPELTSVTLLPGLGMGVLQLTAALPKIGTVSLLANPTVQAMTDASANNPALYETRGAIEAPWGGLLMGLISPIGASMSVNWAGHSLEVPTEVSSRAIDDSGLLAHISIDSQQVNTLAGGSEATAILHATNFNGHWPSRLDIQLSSQLGPSDLTLIVTATNSGQVPVPFGAGWHPRFTVLNQGRDQVELRLPQGDLVESSDSTTEQPTGKFIAPPTQVERMQSRAVALDGTPILLSLAHLKPAMLDAVPTAEFRDPTSGYGLRLSSISSNTRALRVIAPVRNEFVSLGLQTNYDDPFGSMWSTGEGSGMVILQPGQSFEWRVRLEIFPILPHNSSVTD
jgi:aldose 1-epimerase